MARGGCAAPGARDPSRFARARCMLYIITEIKARLEEGLPPFHEIRLFQGERDALFLALVCALFLAIDFGKRVTIIASIILVTRGAKLIRIRRVETGAQSARPSQPLPAQRAPA